MKVKDLKEHDTVYMPYITSLLNVAYNLLTVQYTEEFDNIFSDYVVKFIENEELYLLNGDTELYAL